MTTPAMLEIMTEKELESIINTEGNNQLGNDARYCLGKNCIEGSFPDKVPRNESKGLNWIKEALTNGHLPALEYKTYFDIRFDKHPSIERIIESLEKCAADNNKSPRACATLAEFCHAKEKEEGNKEKAAHYYATAMGEDCIVGTHWMGVYYSEGFGVSQDLKKSETLLLKTAKAGNGQSCFQLYVMYANMPSMKNVEKAYRFLNKALQLGVTHF